MKKSSATKRRERLLALYNQGMSLKDIADRFGVRHQAIQQSLSRHPNYVSRKPKPLEYREVTCGWCSKAITRSAKSINATKYGKVFCSGICGGKANRVYASSEEREKERLARYKARYNTDQAFRKKHIAICRKWQAEKKKSDPAWWEFYKGRQRIATRKFQAKRRERKEKTLGAGKS